MATSVSICSNALLLLGADPISSFTDNDQARLAKNLYQPTVDAVLRRHTWNCCVKRVQLAPESTAPAFDFSNQFLLPSDWLRTLQVGEYGDEIEYKTEGRCILANTDVLPLRYIARVAEDKWDAALIDIVTHAMAARMAFPVTKSTSQQQIMEAKYQQEFAFARAVDGQDDPPETLGDFPSYTSRF